LDDLADEGQARLSLEWNAATFHLPSGFEHDAGDVVPVPSIRLLAQTGQCHAEALGFEGNEGHEAGSCDHDLGEGRKSH